MSIEYQERTISEVVEYFAKDFRTFKGKEIASYEYFIDTNASKIVFKFFVRPKKKVQPKSGRRPE